MALDPDALLEAFLGLDDEPFPRDAHGTAARWFRLFWDYSKKMVLLNIPTDTHHTLVETIARNAFLPRLTPVCAKPSNDPLTFYSALESAVRRAWTDVMLTPTYIAPPGLALVPALTPLAPALLSDGRGGERNRSKIPVRTKMAATFHAWTCDNAVLQPEPAPPLNFY